MKIGIIGSGAVAQTLGKAFLTEGYDVMLGSRDPQKDVLKKWSAENKGSRTGTFLEASKFGDMLVLAVSGEGATAAILGCGIENLKGKTVIDVTNPLSHEPPVNGVLKLTVPMNSSLMEFSQRLAPEAHFVKAFNSVGNARMYKPSYKEGKPSMFICGNNEAAKKQVTAILDKFGWEIEDMGTAEAARAIEPLAMLWCIPGFLRNQWTHAFKLLK